MKKAKILEKNQLGSVFEGKNLKCKICSLELPYENTTIKNNFWTCSKGHANKFNEKYVVPYKSFVFNADILGKIKERLSNLQNESRSTYILYNGGKHPVPILLCDMPSNACLITEGLEKSSLLVYVDENVKQKLSTPYNKNNFVEISSFFLYNDNDLKARLDLIAQSAYPLETINLFNKIANYTKNKGHESFEIEVTKLFDNLKEKEKEAEKLLSFLRQNKENPTGNKFVHIGSNYPVDFCPIELFSYVSGIFEVSSNTGYDAKMFSTPLSFPVYQKKKNSNPGRRLVFITSADEIDNKIWRDILEAKKNNAGWYYLLVDLDLLSLILHFVGEKDYFNS